MVIWINGIIFFQAMQKKIFSNNTILRKKLWNDFVIYTPKTNTSRNLDIKISLQLKYSSCRLQQGGLANVIERKHGLN